MRVTQVVRFDAGLYHGGGEIQAQKTADALTDLGVDVHTYRPDDRVLGDVVHFFGNFDYFDEVAEHCRRLGVPYVVSTLFATPRSESRLRWRAFRTKLLGGYRHQADRLLRGAERLITLNKREETLVRAYFGDALPPVIHLGNGVDPRFGSGKAVWPSGHGEPPQGPFAVSVGSLDKGKNQLAAIRACSGLIPLVVVGPTTSPEYERQCRVEADSTVRFLGRVDSATPDLPNLLSMAHLFVMTSLHELYPLSAMEAAVAGCHLVLPDLWGARDLFGDLASYCDPTNPQSVRHHVEATLALPRPSTRDGFLAANSWNTVAATLLNVYCQLT